MLTFLLIIYWLGIGYIDHMVYYLTTGLQKLFLLSSVVSSYHTEFNTFYPFQSENKLEIFKSVQFELLLHSILVNFCTLEKKSTLPNQQIISALSVSSKLYHILGMCILYGESLVKRKQSPSKSKN